MQIKLPTLMQRTIDPLQNLTDYPDESAIVNVLNAKLANMVSQTGVKFCQYDGATPRLITYYGINFMDSGSKKDFLVDTINRHLLPFVEEEMGKRIEDYKENYKQEQELLRPGREQAKLIEKEVAQIRVANYELFNPNYTGFYREAEQINNIGFGSLFVRIGELGDYLENIVGGNQSKKEFYQKLKDVYEGTVAPSIIAGDSKRKTLKDIPIQVLMYSDFENLLNPKIKEYYLKSLKTGLARRSFIYIPRNKQNICKYPISAEEASLNTRALDVLQSNYLNIFQMLLMKQNKLYKFSKEAREKLYQYQCKCIDSFNNSEDDIIVKIDIKESFWKITKLSVLYSIIDDPTSNIVKQSSVDMAISFYESLDNSVKTIIEMHGTSDAEKLAKFMFINRAKPITRMDIRNSGILNNRNFKKELENILDEVKEELLRNYGFYLYDYNGDRNTKAYQLMEAK